MNDLLYLAERDEMGDEAEFIRWCRKNYMALKQGKYPRAVKKLRIVLSRWFKRSPGCAD